MTKDNNSPKQTRVNKYKSKYELNCNAKAKKTEEDLIREAIEIFDKTEIIDITDIIDKHSKKGNIIPYLILILCISLLIYSGVNIMKWKFDNDNTSKQIDEINEQITIDEIIDNENTEVIEIEEEIDASNPYWDYIKMNLIDVNFQELLNINDNTIGWIQVLGTNINYPVVQTNNNDFYLNHSFNKSRNNAGWVFMDFRNNVYGEDRNTIIYAHGRQDKTMFGSLRNILTNGWLKYPENYVIKLSTEYENSLWQVFSVYHIPTTNDYIRVEFSDSYDFLEFEEMLKNRSVYDFNTNTSNNDRILTLSTCYDLTDKVVLHAKLIKRELK